AQAPSAARNALSSKNATIHFCLTNPHQKAHVDLGISAHPNSVPAIGHISLNKHLRSVHKFITFPPRISHAQTAGLCRAPAGA
ncbi:MAG: hypothetical protein KGN79_08715, partial [Acidobacteriota bacterium]|nr:hypothetical protein [Acidobacteriota bacterium]